MVVKGIGTLNSTGILKKADGLGNGKETGFMIKMLRRNVKCHL